MGWVDTNAHQRGVSWLQLDCWADNERLRQYYEQQGFVLCGTFTVEGWPGVLFEKPVRPIASAPAVS